MKPQSQLTPQEQDFVDRLIAEHSGRPGALLTILEKVRERHPLGQPDHRHRAQQPGHQPLDQAGEPALR